MGVAPLVQVKPIKLVYLDADSKQRSKVFTCEDELIRELGSIREMKLEFLFEDGTPVDRATMNRIYGRLFGRKG